MRVNLSLLLISLPVVAEVRNRQCRMFKIFLITLIVPLIIANPATLFLRPHYNPPKTGKIVGGVVIGIEDAPYQISLQDRNFHICGGSIISDNFVLTAGHCTDGNIAKNLQIRAGSEKYRSGGVIIQVKKIIQHEDFDYNTIDFDFSLLLLDEKFEFSETIQPIALPKQDEPVEDGTMSLVSGWGNTQNSLESREMLRAAYVPSVNQEECQEAYLLFGGVTDRMICAGYKKGGRDACQGYFKTYSKVFNFQTYFRSSGDSGGPLVAENKLIGVVSWGYGCAIPEFPGVYSRVASVRTWIQEKSGV